MKVESVVCCNFWVGGCGFLGILGGITDLAIGRWLDEEEGGGFQLVKTKQIHKLMLTMFDPEEI